MNVKELTAVINNIPEFAPLFELKKAVSDVKQNTIPKGSVVYYKQRTGLFYPLNGKSPIIVNVRELKNIHATINLNTYA